MFDLQEQTVSSKKRLEASETSTRLAAQKLSKSLNKTLPSDDIILPNKLVQELKIKFRDLPESLADLESEIMNFNAQLSCQGTVKDDVRLNFIFFIFEFSLSGYSRISTRKNEINSN